LNVVRGHMGLTDTLIQSVVKVVSGLLGFGFFLGGGQQAAFGSETVGTVRALVGLVLMVFAAKV